MTDHFTARDLIQRLADELEFWSDLACTPSELPFEQDDMLKLITEARAYLAQPEPEGPALDCNEIDVPAYYRGDDFDTYKEGYVSGWAAGIKAQPKPERPTDEELTELWSWAHAEDQGPWPTQQHCFARAVLARYGNHRARRSKHSAT